MRSLLSSRTSLQRAGARSITTGTDLTKTTTATLQLHAMTSSLKDCLTPDTIIKNHYGGYQRHSPRFIVGYWSIRGIGASIRMLLSAAQIDHWVVLYDDKEAADEGWTKESWERDKLLLEEKCPLINLPFLIDCADDRILVQSNAILTYLGRELKLLGTSKEETSKCEQLLCEIMDLRDLMIDFSYETDLSKCEEESKDMLQLATRHFRRLERHLEMEYPNAPERVIERDSLTTLGFAMDSVCHLVGGKFSAPDFHLYEMLDQFEGLCKAFRLPNCLGDATTYSEKVDQIQRWNMPTEKVSIYPYLKEFKDNFLVLSANGVYKRSLSMELPYNSPYARFGSDPVTRGAYTRGQEAPWYSQGVVTNTYTRISSGIEYWDDEDVAAATRMRKEQGW
jgi:hypothetical protein